MWARMPGQHVPVPHVHQCHGATAHMHTGSSARTLSLAPSLGTRCCDCTAAAEQSMAETHIHTSQSEASQLDGALRGVMTAQAAFPLPGPAPACCGTQVPQQARSLTLLLAQASSCLHLDHPQYPHPLRTIPLIHTLLHLHYTTHPQCAAITHLPRPLRQQAPAPAPPAPPAHSLLRGAAPSAATTSAAARCAVSSAACMQGFTATCVASPAKNSVPATGAASASLSPSSTPRLG